MAQWGTSVVGKSWTEDGPAVTDKWSSNSGAVGVWDNNMAHVSEQYGDGGVGDLSLEEERAHNTEACHNCGQEGHFARDCTEPKRMGACFNCGEEGHSKAECTRPRVFKGECRTCGEYGHLAADCPTKPKLCSRCNGDDHEAGDCKNRYVFDFSDVVEMTEIECWRMITEASRNADFDDFKDALRALQRACPDMTYLDLEKRLRAMKTIFHIIALDKDHGDGYTNVSLQGDVGRKYSIGYFRSSYAPRPNMLQQWPRNETENLQRLTDAGETLQSGLIYCRNCEKYGHGTRSCPAEKVEREALQIVCKLCDQVGHRVRDCTEERRKPKTARNCNICDSADHIAKDCDQKPERTPLICRNCDAEGHKASECDQPRKIICRNCDQEGHMAKDCGQPRDWSRVVCRHCGEKGHASAARCKPGAAEAKATAEANDEDGYHNFVHNTTDNAGTEENHLWPSSGTDHGNTGWATNSTPAPVAADSVW